MTRSALPKPNSQSAAPVTSVVLGRDRFARISAVEGIVLTKEMRATLDDFDRAGLAADERRRAIIRRFAARR